MDKVIIFLEAYESVLLWGIKSKDKFIKGVCKNKEEMNDPISTILETFSRSEKFVTNYKFIYDALLKEGCSVILDKEIKIDLSEVKDHLNENDPVLPKELNITSSEDNFEGTVKNVMGLFKTYLYFRENPEKIKDTNLFLEMKQKGIIPEEMLLEDIFVLFEESLA